MQTMFGGFDEVPLVRFVPSTLFNQRSRNLLRRFYPTVSNTLTTGGEISAMPPLGICFGSCCFWGKSKSTLPFDNDTKRIMVYASLHNKLGFPAKAKAKIRACKKDGNRWKRYRTDLRISVGGQVFVDSDVDCNGTTFAKQKASNGGTKRRAKLRVAINNFLGMRFAQDNDISANGFQGSNQSTSLSVFLTF